MPRLIDQPFKFPHNTQGTCTIHTGPGYRNELVLPVIDKSR